jgi:hypothetical protein
MKIDPTLVPMDDGRVFCVVTMSMASSLTSRLLVRVTLGETIDLGLSDWMMATLGAVLPPGPRFGAGDDGRIRRWRA